MFPQQPQQQFRTAGADVQIFYGSGGTTAAQCQRSWNKPVGVSHIYMMLIGGGGNGNAVDTGGNSGAVTVWYGAAQHVPNSLIVNPSSGDSVNTTVTARFSNSTALPTALLTANAGDNTFPGAITNPNQFTASGFFNSVRGANGGGVGSPVTASSTTFLSGGAAGIPSSANYGYVTVDNPNQGFFLLQPIIVGMGGTSSGGSSAKGGIGCGGDVTGKGGPGLVLIASW